LSIGDSGISGLYKTWVEVQHETFGERNAVEGFFSSLRKGRRDFGTDFLSIALFILYRAGLRVLWHSITTGGVKLTPPRGEGQVVILQ